MPTLLHILLDSWLYLVKINDNVLPMRREIQHTWAVWIWWKVILMVRILAWEIQAVHHVMMDISVVSHFCRTNLPYILPTEHQPFLQQLVFALATIGLLFLLFSISSKYAQKCLEAVESGSWSCLCFQQNRDCKSYNPWTNFEKGFSLSHPFLMNALHLWNNLWNIL